MANDNFYDAIELEVKYGDLKLETLLQEAETFRETGTLPQDAVSRELAQEDELQTFFLEVFRYAFLNKEFRNYAEA